MNKIKCLVCKTELESISEYDFVQCSCDNKASVYGGDIYQRVGAFDLTKIQIFSEDNLNYRSVTL